MNLIEYFEQNLNDRDVVSLSSPQNQTLKIVYAYLLVNRRAFLLTLLANGGHVADELLVAGNFILDEV